MVKELEAGAVGPAKRLAVVGFAGGANWPIWVGQKLGFFQRHGVIVDLAFTPNSAEMVQNVMTGRYQVAMTAFDNVVAYQEGQGEAQLLTRPDFFAFMGCDTGFLNVMARGCILNIEDLRGKDVAVDSPTTGFAFVLRAILAHHGIEEGEVRFVSVGGGSQRLTALQKGEQAATLLNTPLDLIAESTGACRLVKAEAVIGPYQGVVGAARRSWAAENADQLIAYMRGYRDSIAWLYDPQNRSAALALLFANMPKLSASLAERTYDVLLAGEGGLIRDLAISRAGMLTVLALRSNFGVPKKILTDPSRYIDLGYREQV